MSPMMRRVLSGVIAMLVSLGAVTAALPPEVTLSNVPLHAWILALLAGATGVYSPKPESTPPNTIEEMKP